MGGTCPFCRCEIKGTETIVVDPFKQQMKDEKLRKDTENSPPLIEKDLLDFQQPVSCGGIFIKCSLSEIQCFFNERAS